MTKGRIDIITMGCSKNLIDSERLMKRLEALEMKVFHNPETPKGEYVVVNTCGFIGDAKEESINMILGLAELKKKKKIGKLVVMGCLSERYRSDLPSEIPEVDLWYGKFDWNSFIDTLKAGVLQKSNTRVLEWERFLTTPPWSAYVKISEGCNRFCSYCAIPLITGRHKSRPIDEIITEVESLVSKGVKEFNIIAQDLSSYGTDLYGSSQLATLIDRMAKVPQVEWIRLHYLYPADFPMDILSVMNRHDNVCKYLDIALQHISDKVLQPMRRHISKDETLQLLSDIRSRVPGIHIRTTVMTGFPGEDEDAYEELLNFVKTQKFERLGGFSYCEEDDTFAARSLDDNIPQHIKEKRLEEIMNIQQDISEELNNKKIGSIIKVLVEERNGNSGIGRSEYDSPEVDQEVLIEGCSASPGEFVYVEIIGAGPFELRGRQVKL